MKQPLRRTAVSGTAHVSVYDSTIDATPEITLIDTDTYSASGLRAAATPA
jgi:hypothetical protein